MLALFAAFSVSSVAMINTTKTLSLVNIVVYRCLLYYYIEKLKQKKKNAKLVQCLLIASVVANILVLRQSYRLTVGADITSKTV